MRILPPFKFSLLRVKKRMPGVLLSARHLQGFILLWILLRKKMFSCYRMNKNVVIQLMSVITVCIYTVQSQTATPVVTPADLQAKITANSVILKKPNCYFNVTCPNCAIWLVPALSSATSTFDADRTISNILTLSPYPSAFGPLSKNYFLTRVGALSDFPCNALSDTLYFVVGADGNCTTVNCNGILPTGSVVRFKYVLVNESGIINETNWSANVTLKAPQNPASIYDGFIARSGAMVVITTILSVAAGLLLLLFFIMLCVVCCHKKETKPNTVKSSIRMPHYDIHNLKERVHPYDNPAYQMERKK